MNIEPHLASVLTLVDRYPVISALVIIILLDIVCGTAVAVSNKALCSTISFRGMCRKAVELIIVMAAMTLEPFIELEDGINFPLGKLVAIFFLYSETISILEKAALLGVPIPPVLLDVLVRIRTSARSSPPGQVTNEIHSTGPIVVHHTGETHLDQPSSPAKPTGVPPNIPLLIVLGAAFLFSSCAGGGLRQEGRITETYQRWDIPSLFERHEDAPSDGKSVMSGEAES